MSYLSNDLREKLHSVVNRKFTRVLFRKIDSLIDFINNISDLREGFPDFDESLIINNLEKVKEINDQIDSLVNEQFRKKAPAVFDEIFPELIESINDTLTSLDLIVKPEQDAARFFPVYNDKPFIKILKRVKNFLYILYTYYIKSLNYILGIFNLKAREIRYWTHIIPLRNVGYHYLRDKFLIEITGIYEDFCREYRKASISVWQIDEKYDHNFINNFTPFEERIEVKASALNSEQIVKELQDYKEEIADKVKGVVSECIEEFEDACEKTGTIELKKTKFVNRLIVKDHQRKKIFFERIIEEWDNNHYALGEKWELNCDLLSVRYSALRVFYKLDKSLSIKIKIRILPPFYDVANTFENILTEITGGAAGSEEFTGLLKVVKGKVQEELLAATLPGLISIISDMQIPEMIDDAGNELSDLINSLPETRILVSSGRYNSRITAGELERIYPGEFLTFKALPSLKKTFSKIISDLGFELEKVQSELINLGNMADFNIESAITALSTNELTEHEIKEVALEGIRVCYKKNEEIRDLYQNICRNVIKGINRSILVFNEEIYSFTQTSKISEIRIQLTRAKAKVRTQQAREKFYSSVKYFFPKLLNAIGKFYRQGSRVYSDTKKQLNFIEKPAYITSEVSDFLSRVNSSVEKLPYIYRRLFQLKPLENARLYVPRTEEEEQLKNAFANWMHGGYAPVILTSEKGGGITTFINIAAASLADQVSLTRINARPTIYTEDKLLGLFKLIVNIDDISSQDEIIKALTTLKSKKIIVIENLQHIFLRTVRGFKCLKILLEIISKTNNNVFWILTSTQYAFEYLKKTINVEDYFGYHIELRSIDNEQIVNLIKKRNSISGYNLQYEVWGNKKRNKEFSKLPAVEVQKILEKEFFILLNRYAQSNISLALLFWLRSIVEIKDRNLQIKPNLELTTSILNSLPQDKIFILHSLVLHDGLKSEELQKTINFSLNETNLLLQILSDDGVLVKNDNAYFINPMLYRQAVALLKTKNFLD